MAGATDPDNRRPLWQYASYNESSPRYLLIQKLNAARNQLKMGNLDFKETSVTDSQYCYSRGGKMTTCVSNAGSGLRAVQEHRV